MIDELKVAPDSVLSASAEFVEVSRSYPGLTSFKQMPMVPEGFSNDIHDFSTEIHDNFFFWKTNTESTFVRQL